MTEETPIWRIAFQEKEHPMHMAARLLFTTPFNPTFADKKLAAQKDEVIEFLYAILDDPVLPDMKSLGRGMAPVHAMALLGEWQVAAALPRLLHILEEEDWDTSLSESCSSALNKIAPLVVDELIDYADNLPEDSDLWIKVGSALSESVGNDQAYTVVEKIFLQQTDEWDIEFMAEMVAHCNPEKATKLLNDLLRQKKYSRKIKERFKQVIKWAEDGVV